MTSRILRSIPCKNTAVFTILIIAYFLIGLHLIATTSLTSDEPAYVGAAYAYTEGVGLNPEHPLLLKLLNAVLIKLFFSEIHVPIPEVTSFEDRGGIRLIAYYVGRDFLTAKPDMFLSLVFSSRLLYLTFNSLLLLWLAIYSLIFKLINTQWAIILGVLYVFSPSFYSHSFLISFDVPVAICAFMSILSLVLIITNVTKFSVRQLVMHFSIATILLFFAINTKFSNLMLLPIFGVTYIGTAAYLTKQCKSKLAYQFTSLSVFCILVQPWLTLGMYRIGFSSLPNQSIADNLARYWDGIRMTIITARSVIEPFLFGQFVSITYIKYVERIFWFKENPILFLLALMSIIYLAAMLARKHRYLLELVYGLSKKQKYHIISCSVLLLIYPLLYTYIAKHSRFVIGYRYFYPVILFIYFYLAVLATRLKRAILGACLVLYGIFGLMGISQSLSYVNPFWTQEKWLLANDSTLNWGQETQHAVQYLLNHRLLSPQNLRDLTYRTFGAMVNVPEYLLLLSQEHNYTLGSQSYFDSPRFDPYHSDISQLAEKYLLIDSTVIQRIFSDTAIHPLSAKNWQFLSTHKPIYSRNGIIFIYQLH
jgi:hypothetical protein